MPGNRFKVPRGGEGHCLRKSSASGDLSRTMFGQSEWGAVLFETYFRARSGRCFVFSIFIGRASPDRAGARPLSCNRGITYLSRATRMLGTRSERVPKHQAAYHATASCSAGARLFVRPVAVLFGVGLASVDIRDVVGIHCRMSEDRSLVSRRSTPTRFTLLVDRARRRQAGHQPSFAV
jgi:hypothetical protein